MGSQVRVLANHHPQALTYAQFSLLHLATVQLLRVLPGYEWLTGDRWLDPAVLCILNPS